MHMLTPALYPNIPPPQLSILIYYPENYQKPFLIYLNTKMEKCCFIIDLRCIYADISYLRVIKGSLTSLLCSFCDCFRGLMGWRCKHCFAHVHILMYMHILRYVPVSENVHRSDMCSCRFQLSFLLLG